MNTMKRLLHVGSLTISSVALLIGMGGIGLILTEPATAAGLAIDAQSSGKATGGSSVTSAALNTTQKNDLLVAFLGSDGPAQAQSQAFSSVTGGNLNWQLRERSNAQFGDSEIWTASTANTVSSLTVKATHSGAYASSVYVVAFSGANATINGAVSAASAASGAPIATLTTTQADSWVWAAGNDWDNASARTVGSNQTLNHQYLNTSSGDSFWTQSQTNPSGAAGSKVTINDTAPTGDRWNLALFEIVPAVTDTTPPTIPQNLSASSPNSYAIVLNWQASTDNIGVAGYNVYRNGSLLTSAVVSPTYTDTAVNPNTNYSYTVSAYDAAGNTSAQSTPVAITTGPPDTTPPVVAMTTPSSNAVVSGTISVSATASDDVSVKNVQFTVTNLVTNAQTNIGGAVVTAPYQASWDTTTVGNGNYALSAIATDEAGNSTAAPIVDVTVNNVAPTAPKIDPSTPAAIGIPGSTCSNPVQTVSTPAFSPPANSRIYIVAAADSYPMGDTNCLNETGQNSIASVASTAGTTWSRVAYTTQRSSSVGGFVDVWSTTLPTAQANMAITVNFAAPMKAEPNQVSPSGMLKVIVVDGAGANQTVSPVTVDQMNSMTSSATATVNNVPTNSLVFMAVDYWNSYSTPPTVPTGQVVLDNVNNQGEVDTWTISGTTQPTTSGPAPVKLTQTITDPNNTTDNWHAVAWAVTP